MVKAVVVRQKGGPEVLKLEDVTVGEPKIGEIKLRHTAAGVNFVDTYYRSGLYAAAPAAGLPDGVFIPGQEGVGEVIEVGAGVTGLQVGDRVAYAEGPTGSYAEQRIIPASSVVKVPAGLEDAKVAGMMLRGLTAWYLTHRVHELKSGETVLFHAAAGGVGQLFCQWARALGVTVIGTVSTEEKAAIAKEAGCAHTILYKREDWVTKVRELTDGKGVSVVYDGVGKETFEGSLDCLNRFGLMCSFGNASGPVEPIQPIVLAKRGSLFLTRPRLTDYIAERKDYEQAADKLFDVVNRGIVKVEVGRSYPLDEAAQAHRDLEGRSTTGSTILVL